MRKYRVDEDGDIIVSTNGCDSFIDKDDLEHHLNSLSLELEKCYSEIADKEKEIHELYLLGPKNQQKADRNMMHRIKFNGRTIIEFENRFNARAKWNEMNKSWREESLWNKGEKYTLHKESRWLWKGSKC